MKKQSVETRIKRSNNYIKKGTGYKVWLKRKENEDMELLHRYPSTSQLGKILKEAKKKIEPIDVREFWRKDEPISAGSQIEWLRNKINELIDRLTEKLEEI